MKHSEKHISKEMCFLHIGKGIKWKGVVQTIKGTKKAEKTSKIVLTNGDSGGNITKLSRETPVKTK
jgi:hypothetical protein